MKKKYSKYSLFNYIILFELIVILGLLTSSISLAASYKLNKTKLTMHISQSITLKVNDSKHYISWTSSNKKVAIVSTDGKVTALASGKAIITASIVNQKLKCNIHVKKPNGKNNNPYIGYDQKTMLFQDYIFSKSQEISMQLEQTIVGDSAYEILRNENMFNKKPTKNTHWILYQFHLKYRKGSGTKTLSASDVLQNYKCFYESDGKTPVKVKEFAFFNKLRAGKDLYDVVLKEGEESDVWVGILIDNSISYPLYRIPVKGEKYLWFSTNPIVTQND
ncbi:Ig-like domain-containing protein [Anaeromicropila herbilytica]|uniref:BIG2 domain-containing protein n=1 Tax=Anaeromicropila herbilytica TaxID=2785025 RepID=A0A7R7EML8_9FIRM|nr:Ig-like domain-containing protein [Anaeromicropila herbilytica]BCN31735.1 hypothetical protein bsdtb5_30300 [Anaeromicropila herbilytica]